MSDLFASSLPVWRYVTAVFGTPSKVDLEAPDYVQIWPNLTVLRDSGLGASRFWSGGFY